MQVIAESNWNWMLYQKNDDCILSVLCGTGGLYSCVITLLPEELSDYWSKGETAIEQLARAVSYNSEAYKSRNMQNFHLDDAAKLAAREWRVQDAQKP